MIQSRSIFCEKYVTFHGPTQFDFTDGITVIRGENRSGKSVLFSGLGNLLYGSPPIIQAKNKAKQMHVRGGSTFAYHCIVDGHEIELSQALVGQTLKYAIKIDGKDKGTHTQNAFFEIMEEYIPTPEDLFYSSKYISGLRPNPLHLGTGAQRMSYLQNMFDFEKFDDLRVRLIELLDRSSKAVAEAEALKAERRSLPGGSAWSRTTHEKLDNVLLFFKKQASAANRNAKYQGEIESLQKVSGAQHPIDALMEKLEQLDVRLSEVKKLLDDADEAQEARTEYKAALKRHTEVEAEASKLRKHKQFEIFSKSDPSELRIAEDKAMSDFHRKKLDFNLMNNSFEVNARIEAAVAKRPAEIETDLVPAKFLNNISKTEAQLRRTIDELEESINSHSGLSKGDHCPTCGQKVKTDFDAAVAKAKLKKTREALRFVKNIISIGNYSTDLNKAALEEAQSAVALAKEKHAEAEQLSAMAAKWKGVSTELKELNATIKKTEKYAESKTDTKRLSVTLEQLKEQRRDLKAAIEARSRIDALNEIISKDSDTNLSPDSLSLAVEVLTQTKSEASALAKSYRRKEQIEKRLKELGKTVEYQDILKALVDAYGPRGVRVDQMAKIALRLEQSFNSFAPFIFPEPAYFSFNVAPSNVTVGMERNALPPSDAALISGSEARCFQVLCYAALTPFIPARYRFDSVVLDELESMMTPTTRKLYIENAIPRIAESVRSLTVVTPLPEEEFFIEVDRTVHVIKENSRSRLEVIR